MNIVYNCNEAFAVHTAVSITSLFENNKNAEEISVYILGNAISGDSIARFEEIAADYSDISSGRERSVIVLDLKDYGAKLLSLFGKDLDTGSFDPTVLARLFAPQYLPEKVDRYIYLDADTIVRGDISGLWKEELDSCICAMAAEPTIYADTRSRLGFTDNDPYFNSGMMLVDRIAWEREKITESCVEYYSAAGGKGLSFPDQDIINYVLKGKIKQTWQGWNFFSNYCYQSFDSLCSRALWYAASADRTSYEKARKNPAVVHFAGAERPWLKGNYNPYSAEYHKYLDLTPWRGTADQKGREAQMLMYHMMNVVTKYCPKAREAISSLYYLGHVK